MSWLLETPWPAIIGGAIAEVALGFMYFTSGRLRLLLWMGVAAAVAASLILLQWFVVTDREQITANVNAAAEAASRGDVEGVLGFISPSAEALRLRARGVIAMRPSSVRVVILKLEILKNENPPQARLNCLAMVKHPLYKGETPVKVEAFLRKHDAKWVVYDAREQLGL